jgi:transposase InsO family protein
LFPNNDSINHKYKSVSLATFKLAEETALAVNKYILFYNTKRPHRKLQYKTPEQKEQEYALKQAAF